MTIHVHATYRAGAIHPDQPLELPDNTEVQVTIVPVVATAGEGSGEQVDIDAIRPKAPRFTAQELHERLAKHAVRVGTLPPDFSREDIYSDHD
jgi:hypothetical protein